MQPTARMATVHEVITAPAIAALPPAGPAICGTVTLHCFEKGEPLRLVMPMMDALLLLNSLRVIEREHELQEWSQRLGCSLNRIDELSAEVAQLAAPRPAIGQSDAA